MRSVLQAASLLCAGLGLVSAAAVLARRRDLHLGVAVLLPFLLAAGLLRLSSGTTWSALAAAALLVALLRLPGTALARPADRG